MRASKHMTVFQLSAFSWAINIPSMNTCLIAEVDSNHNNLCVFCDPLYVSKVRFHHVVNMLNEDILIKHICRHDICTRYRKYG